MLFQIIATFEDGDQDIFEIDLGYVNDEKNFITNILDSLDDEKIKDLIKLGRIMKKGFGSSVLE